MYESFIYLHWLMTAAGKFLYLRSAASRGGICSSWTTILVPCCLLTTPKKPALLSGFTSFTVV